LEAEVNGRRGYTIRAEDGVGELEAGISPTVEAFVK